MLEQLVDKQLAVEELIVWAAVFYLERTSTYGVSLAAV